MGDILEIVKEISQDRQFSMFTYKNEIWLSGYKDNVKIDIFIKFFKDGKVKLIYETPFERKVALFLNSDTAAKSLLNYCKVV